MKTISKYLRYWLVTAFLMASILLSCSSSQTRECPDATTQKFTVDKEFTKVTAGGDITFVITHDKSLPEYTIKATGCSTDLSDMKLEVTNGVLDVRFTKHRRERHRINIRILSPLPVEVQYFKNPNVVKKSEPGWPRE